MKINIFNETCLDLSSPRRARQEAPEKIIKKIAKAIENSSLKQLKSSSINLIIKTSQAISKLNKELFNRDSPTDVISVNQPQASSSHRIANSEKRAASGDIYICPEVIESNAKKYNVSYNEELARVIIHGILHLAGYDHKRPYGKSREVMFKKQEAILKQVLKK